MIDLSKTPTAREERLENEKLELEQIIDDLKQDIEDLRKENKHLAEDNHKLTVLTAIAEEMFMEMGKGSVIEAPKKPAIILQ